MYRLLTLGMKETVSNEFQLIVLLKDPERIASISLTRERIISETGKRFWDIGYVTQVEEIQETSDKNGNITVKVLGEVRLEEECKTGNLKKYFDSRSRNAPYFFETESSVYGIIKVEKVLSLDENFEKNTFRMTLKVENVPLFYTKNILNKDYRWKRYWQKIGEGIRLEETKNRYIDLFNNGERKLYIIMYRHKYDRSSAQWIAGMHWL